MQLHSYVYAQWLAGRGVASQQVTEAALVHLPVYIYKYDFGGKSYTAMVEGASGKVFANIYPAKAEAPYFLVAAFALLGFLVISTIPLIGYALGEGVGLAVGLVVMLVLAAIFAVPVFALAAYISSKV